VNLSTASTKPFWQLAVSDNIINFTKKLLVLHVQICSNAVLSSWVHNGHTSLGVKNVNSLYLLTLPRTKRPMQLRQFSVYCAPRLSTNHSLFIYQTSLLWLQQRHLVAKPGGSRRELATEICLSMSLSCIKGSLTCSKMLRHGADSFASPPKEVVLRIFIALKKPSPSAEFLHANLLSSDKHENHYASGNDNIQLIMTCLWFQNYTKYLIFIW
jgi:hypothetical protein